MAANIFHAALKHLPELLQPWNGYDFNDNRSIMNCIYMDDFCSNYPASVVCPYCDGGIGTEELDHYLCKSRFPRLACSPWNLVPDKDDLLRAWNEYFGD